MKTRYRAGMIKKIAAVALLCAAFFAAAGGASARAQGGVKLDAQAGLDGICKFDEWLPVRVTVENSGADVDARVQVSYRNDNGGQSVHALEISLPASSRKEFFLYIRLTGGAGNLKASVLDGKTELANKKLNLTCGGAEDLTFGVLADDPAPFAILNDLRPLRGGKTRLVYLTVKDLPDQAQGWRMLDALVVSGVDTAQMTAAQSAALRMWLAGGGKLFVVGGIHWQAAVSGLRDVLPVEISATRNVNRLSALSAYVRDEETPEGVILLASGKVAADAQALVTQDDILLLAEKRMGYGKAYYFAADPGLQPLAEWKGMREVYEHLLAFKPQRPAWANARWDSSSANNALSALPELDLPSFFYICCWIGVYILAIGPVNYLILRRLKRAELAWVTIPALVVIFSCIAYVFGFAYRGTDPVLNRLALLQGWDGVPQARANDLVGLYSPSRSAYAVEAREQFMLYQPDGFSAYVQGGNDWLLFKTEEGTALPDARVEIGGVVSLGAEGYLPAPGLRHDLTLALSSASPLLKGTIANTGGHTLRGAVLVTPNGWNSLGDIAPGESVEVNLAVVAQTFPLDLYRVFSDLSLPYYAYGDSDKDLLRRAGFLRASLYGYEGSSASGIYLAGWVDDIAAPVTLREQESDNLDTALYFHKLEPRQTVKSESFVVNSSIYDWESSLGVLVPYQVPADGYEIRFQPQVPMTFGTAASLRIDLPNSSPAAANLGVALWNFETRRWDDFPMTTAAFIAIPEPARYVGADGEIRLRLKAGQNDYVQVQTIAFTLAVKP